MPAKKRIKLINPKREPLTVEKCDYCVLPNQSISIFNGTIAIF